MAIGFFDGVHLGHAEVIRKAVQLAKERNLVAAALTFDPHPRAVLGKGEQFSSVLTPTDRKLALLAELGVEAAYVVRFDETFAALSAETFVRGLLLPIGVRTAVIGFDFRFGHRGQGDAGTLRTCSEGTIDVVVVEPVFRAGKKVSSTSIRESIAEGDAAGAAELLGRPFELSGEVVHGDARGRTIGYPTANVEPADPYVMPRTGVYAITATVPANADEPAKDFDAILNVGFRPTFDAPGGKPKLEAHLFDFDGDLYGQQLTLALHRFIRAERKFGSIEELVAQIRSDSEEAKRLLSTR